MFEKHLLSERNPAPALPSGSKDMTVSLWLFTEENHVGFISPHGSALPWAKKERL